MVRFTVYGEPCGKGRPRFAVTQNGVKAYTPKRTTSYEDIIAWSYLSQYKEMAFPSGPLRITIFAYFPISKSDSKKTRNDKIDHIILPTVKPDIDNISKLVMDALNNLAYKDDSQICQLVAIKCYGTEPRVTVTIDHFDVLEQ